MADTDTVKTRAHDLAVSPLLVDRQLSVSEWTVANWLADAAFLLAHAMDGVVWGVIQKRQLRTAETRSGNPWPPLRWTTLLDLRIFDANAEIRLWRTGTGELRAVRVTETEGTRFYASLDRTYLLLGTNDPEHRADGFDVRRSSRGEVHAVPGGAAKLRVRHSYVRDQESGLLREAEHRWLGLLDAQQNIVEVP